MNNYPYWVITKVFNEIKEITSLEKEVQVEEAENTSIKNHFLVLAYQGEKGIHIVNSMERYVNKILPENVKIQTTFTGKRMSSCIKTKQANIIYQLKCSSETCLDDYIGGPARHVIERVKDHSGKDTKLHVLKHTSEK